MVFRVYTSPRPSQGEDFDSGRIDPKWVITFEGWACLRHWLRHYYPVGYRIESPFSHNQLFIIEEPPNFDELEGPARIVRAPEIQTPEQLAEFLENVAHVGQLRRHYHILANGEE